MIGSVQNCSESFGIVRIVSNLAEFIRIALSNAILDRPNGTKLDKTGQKETIETNDRRTRREIK